MGTAEDSRGNRIVWRDPVAEPPFAVEFLGEGASVTIGAGCVAASPSLVLGGGCTLVVGDRCRIANLDLYLARDCAVRIGDDTGFTWRTRLHAHEPYDIDIGRECLFSDEVWITTSDMHSILDDATGERINPGAPVNVGDRVWIGHGVSVMKGARIGAGSVIGTGSIVSGAIAGGCLAAGIPARVLRTGIRWQHDLIDGRAAG